MYEKMLRIRMSEERLVKLWDLGHIRSPIHLSIGQEAVAVGVCNALRKEDIIFSTHRCHAHYMAKGGNLKAMYAELMGKADGCSQGRGGSMHLFDLAAGVFLSVPIVGASIPIAVGSALSSQLKRSARVSVVFFGDGAVEEGVFWESLNFASVRKLPIIFVCENNGYATHSPLSKRQPNDDISARMIPHGVYSVSVDGNNVNEVYQEAQKMVVRARAGEGPAFMEAKTYRWHEHWGPGEDWHLGYRDKKEGESWKARCPIKQIEKDLIQDGCKPKYFKQVRQDINEELMRAVVFAEKSPEANEKKLQ